MILIKLYKTVDAREGLEARPQEFFVSLRKRPVQTPAFLSAQRLNSLKSTGPRTLAGKARSSLNALKHGRFAHGLPEKLVASRQFGEAALHASILRTYQTTFAAVGPSGMKQAENFANASYALARQARIFGTKPECALFSTRLGPRSTSLFRFCVSDRQWRVGLVFWVQRKGFWNMERLMAAMTTPSALSPEPPLGRMLEGRIRHRVFRMYRPGLWERQAFGLDRHGLPDLSLKPRRDSQRILDMFGGRWFEMPAG